jgi:hypothetical protein
LLESDNGDMGEDGSDGARGNVTVEGLADWGHGNEVCSDVRSLGAVEPGSRNEKKLCERECLWWWPRRDPWGIGGGSSSVEATMGGRRPPKVKPSPNFFGGLERVGDALGIGTPTWEKSSVGGLISISCEPSSTMVLWGSEPGRGKNTDRFREWTRECRRE